MYDGPAPVISWPDRPRAITTAIIMHIRIERRLDPVCLLVDSLLFLFFFPALFFFFLLLLLLLLLLFLVRYCASLLFGLLFHLPETRYPPVALSNGYDGLLFLCRFVSFRSDAGGARNDSQHWALDLDAFDIPGWMKTTRCCPFFSKNTPSISDCTPF